MKFTHLHVHSHYSILDGMSAIPELVNKSLKLGMNAIALTDHGVMYGVKEFYDYCQKHNKKVKEKIKDLNKAWKDAPEEEKEKLEKEIQNAEKGYFKPILGCEVYVAKVTQSNLEGSRHVKSQRENQSGHHLILLAKNKIGYQNLCKLVSLGWLEGKYMRPRIDKELLEKYHEGLIVCSACMAGEINRKITANDLMGAREAAFWFKNLFGDDYYIELQLHKKSLDDKDTDLSSGQLHNNNMLLQIAQELNIKTIATNDVHFVEENHAQAHDRLICLSTGKDFDDPARMRYSTQEWLKSSQEMADLFPNTLESITNTQEIADKVEFYSLDSLPLMPNFPIPADFGTEEDYRSKYSHEDLMAEFEPDDASKGRIERLGGFDKVYRIKFEADYLQRLTMEGAQKRYEEIWEELQERIDFELSVMKNMGYPGYFLIVQDFIAQARKMGVRVGPGRGSAAGSVVAYCLGITNIDPLKYDLLFERFLNPDRISLPDIDIDFDDEGRRSVLKWVTEKYGEECVAHIVTYSTMGAKSSIKDVARVQKLPLEKSNQLAKMIPDGLPENKETGAMPPVNIANCIKYVPEFAKESVSTDKNVATTIQYAKELEGTVRQTGVHACGVIIAPGDLTNYVPLAIQKDAKTGEDTLVTQYEGSTIEDIGLIKMDFLGLKTLTIIKETIANIKKSRNIEVDIDQIPLDDPATFKLFGDGATTALFQFESAGMQKYLKELKPNTLEDLIAMTSLYRPGPMQYIPDFISRKHGLQKIEYDFPIMEKRLKDTYGITVYQEQVMLLSRDMAGFTRGESDELRKAMGKKLMEKMAALKAKFIEGATKNGLEPVAKLEKVWSDWAEFAKYAFNKSHATCYAWVSYQTAYLKANYTAEFMAANLTNNLNDVSEIALLIADCKRMGIKVLGPDINESEKHFTVNPKGEIRFGLGGIKGVGDAAVDEIVQERDTNGKYESVLDFIQRTNMRTCNRRCLESLAQAGCFDTYSNIHRAQFFVEADGENFVAKLVKYAAKYQSSKSQNQISLFGDVQNETSDESLLEFPSCQPWSFLTRAKKEKELTGFYISGHPLEEHRLVIRSFCKHTLEDLNQPNALLKFANCDLTFAAMVTAAVKGLTKSGDEYGRITLEDFTDTYEVMLWREDFLKFWHFLDSDSAMVYISARPKKRYGRQDETENAYTLEIRDVKLLSEMTEKLGKAVEITLSLLQLDDSLIAGLMELFTQHQLANGASVSFVIKDADPQLACMLSSSFKVNVNTFPHAVIALLKDEDAVKLK